MTKDEKIEALIHALKKVAFYREHYDYCQIDQTDFCTCGLREAMDAARKAVAAKTE